MLKKRIFCIVGFMLLSSCNCSPPLRITSIQNTDKKLACKDIILEINEAEHYGQQASKAGGVSLDEILVPTCWITGYLDARQANKSAEARIEYLGHIYDLLDCGKATPDAPAIAVPRPPAIPQQPPRAVQAPPPAALQQQMPPPYLGQPNQFNPYANQGAPKVPPYNKAPESALKNDPHLHEHIDKNGKRYRHSHEHKGPHRHSTDNPDN